MRKSLACTCKIIRDYHVAHGHFGYRPQYQPFVLRVDTKGDDQNAHVNFCLSHLLYLLSQRFVFRNAKYVYFCVEKENGTIKMA